MNWRLKNHDITSLREYFLSNMGVKDLEDVNQIYRKSRAGGYVVTGIQKAVSLAKSFSDKPVRIMGDYDADGQAGTAILLLALRESGFSDVSFDIPARFSEGFGLNPKMIDHFYEEKGSTGLIITVDNGIAQNDAIQYAKDFGFTVIVIDHHLPEVVDGVELIPDADVIINPHIVAGSSFDGYCGAGLAFKFSEQLLGKTPIMSHLKVLCGIATVADVMDIKEENYVYVRDAINLLNKGACFKGLKTLLDLTNIGKVTSKDIGFTLAPIINAASRMDDTGAADGVRFLMSNSEEAVSLCNILIERNEMRKNYKKAALKAADNIIQEEGLTNPLVLYIPNSHEGVIGIIAGALVEKYSLPAFVVTDGEAEGVLKGSARGVEGFDIKKALDTCSALLLTHGGHEGAGGLSLNSSNFEEFKKMLIDFSNEIEYQNDNIRFYDFEIDESEVKDFLDELPKYGPYGKANPEPIFKVNLSIQSKQILGAGTVKFKGFHTDGLGFGLADKLDGINPEKISLFGTLSQNFFRGNVSNQVLFSDYEI